jgi:hypothetical protein
MPSLIDLLKRYEALPPTAIVPSKVAAAVIGQSERTIRYRADLPRRYTGPRNYGYLKRDVDRVCGVSS